MPVMIILLVFASAGTMLGVTLVGGFLMAPLFIIPYLVETEGISIWWQLFPYAWMAWWFLIMWLFLWDTPTTRWIDDSVVTPIAKRYFGWEYKPYVREPIQPKQLLTPTHGGPPYWSELKGNE